MARFRILLPKVKNYDNYFVSGGALFGASQRHFTKLITKEEAKKNGL
ncbi:hypothetical protein [Pedobacter gandavensis]|nr:hypothetical protein [Pedobacter gandavensis]